MTKQIEDLIEIDGEQRRLRGWPLEDYWESKRKPRPEFPPIGTNCLHRYRAVWVVSGDQLFLKSVGAGSEFVKNADGGTLSMFIHEYLPAVFPGQDQPVPANWVSGEFYTESMDKTKAEMLTFKKGVLTSRQPCEPFDPYARHRERMVELLKDMERRKLH